MNLPSREDFRNAGLATGTDKVCRHAYDRFYPHFLATYDGKGSILEIGYGNGESIKFWNRLYPKAFVYVLDRDVDLNGSNFKVIKCDQSRISDLQNALHFLDDKEISVIIDDGSHVPEHQLLTFNILFSGLLRAGGCYIIEDVECSYWRYGDVYGYPTRYGLDSSSSLINILSSLPNLINRQYLAKIEKANLEKRLILSGLDLDTAFSIASIKFSQNCIGLIKASIEDSVLMSREYWSSFNVEPASQTIIQSYFPNINPKLKRILYKIIDFALQLRKTIYFG